MIREGKSLWNTRIATVSSTSFFFYFFSLGGRGTFINLFQRNIFLKCTKVFLQLMLQLLQTEKTVNNVKRPLTGHWLQKREWSQGRTLAETPEVMRARRDAHAPRRAQGHGVQCSRPGSTRGLPGLSRSQGPGSFSRKNCEINSYGKY